MSADRSIDAVLFDLHGVLTPSPWARLAAIGGASGRSEAEILEVVVGPYDIDADHPWHRLERGEIKMADYAVAVMALGEAAGIPIDFGRLRGFSGSSEPDAVMVARVASLRAGGYKTALVTNNVREMAGSWRTLIDCDALFDAVVDSSEIGMRKPNPAIFQHALAMLGDIAPERAVFLDDAPGNVAGAARIGLHTILVTETGAALRRLDALLNGKETACN